MAIVQAPIFNPSSISYPTEFITNITSANTILFAQAQLLVNGATVSVIEIPPFQVVASTIYFFRIDFKAVANELTAPIAQNKSSIFGDVLNTEYKAFNSDNLADLALLVTYFEADPITGKPVNTGVVDLVPFGNYAVLNVTRQRREDLSLDEFTIAPRRTYTNSLNPYKIGREENSFLTFPTVFTNSIRIRTFDSSGAVIDTAYTNKPLVNDQVPYTIGVGINQLDNTVINFGSLNILNPAVASYEITAGLRFGAFFLPITIPKVYTIIDQCTERSLRIHFLNILGGADAFTFTSKKTAIIESKSKTGNIPLSWNYTATPPSNIYDKGRFKIDTTAKEVYEVESKIFAEEEGRFITELFTSPETYIETPEGLLPCLVRDSSIKYSEVDSLLTVSATIEVAVDISLQSY